MKHSVYTPGAGHSPRVLAGRDRLLQQWQGIVNDVVVDGRRRAQDTILVGPRGVGKTVTVAEFGALAAERGFEVVNLQAVAGHTGLVDALLQHAQSRIDQGAGPWQRARSALERLGGLNLSIAGFGAGVTARTPRDSPRTVDAGTLAATLATLAEEVRADQKLGGLLITVDELQAASATDLALFAAALHRLNVDHPSSAVLFAGTGLPHTPEVLRKAGVTHPDRLFVPEQIPLTLADIDATYAVVEPARRAGVIWQPEAAARLVDVTNGYPAHLQLFADATWLRAVGPSFITLDDVEAAIPDVADQVERRTLGPRWDRISDRQMEFLAALALLGGRAPVARLARLLGRTTSDLSWIRQELLDEGDVYSPRRGHIAMAIPLFAPYVLAAYEQERRDATISLLSLEQLSARLAAEELPV